MTKAIIKNTIIISITSLFFNRFKQFLLTNRNQYSFVLYYIKIIKYKSKQHSWYRQTFCDVFCPEGKMALNDAIAKRNTPTFLFHGNNSMPYAYIPSFTRLFTAFATSVLLLFAKLVVVTATTIINEIIIFFIPYYI